MKEEERKEGRKKERRRLLFTAQLSYLAAFLKPYYVGQKQEQFFLKIFSSRRVKFT